MGFLCRLYQNLQEWVDEFSYCCENVFSALRGKNISFSEGALNIWHLS